VTCDGARVTLSGDAFAQLTVKAPGFEHATRSVGPDPGADAGPDGALARGPWTLTPLPAFQVTDDYATGLDAGQGLEAARAAFEALAVPFDTELGPSLVVKFYVADLRGETPTVYLHDTKRHPLHYDFYRDVLGGTATRAEFEAATYHGEDRTAAAGTLVFYPQLAGDHPAPVALTFFPSDDLSPALALRVYGLVEARLGFLAPAGAARRLVYVPAGDVQEGQTREAAAAWRFAAQDAPWMAHSDLYAGVTEQRLNPGVTFGTLRRLTPEQLERTVVSYQDVLLLPRLPNEVPLVGGSITEELQTPLAHVNVAARARGTPNLALPGAGERPEVAALVGHPVRFEVTPSSWSLTAATQAQVDAFWAARAPAPKVPVFDVERQGLLGFDDIGFADAIAVGVKAANLAELHHLLPDHSPPGFAVPFYYYDQFMRSPAVTPAACDGAQTDCLEEGRPAAVCAAARALCLPAGAQGPGAAEVLYDHVERLLGDASFRGDTATREAALDNLRWIMRHATVDPDFGAALDAEIAARLGPSARVRLRSSTNAEDLPDFSGAGLYDSYGADPSGSDAASLEIRKVWASAWTWRAFEERSFWNVDHHAVRMGVAVHPAYRDEQVNGVLITRNLADPTVAGYYVNAQRGEVSVTNPTGGALPEVFTVVEAPGGGVQVVRQRFSSLSPGVPLMTQAEATALFVAASQIQAHFAPLYGASPYDFPLDMEFKLDGPQRHLVLKQVRPYHVAQSP